MTAATEGLTKLDISVENLNTGLRKGDKCPQFAYTKGRKIERAI